MNIKMQIKDKIRNNRKLLNYILLPQVQWISKLPKLVLFILFISTYKEGIIEYERIDLYYTMLINALLVPLTGAMYNGKEKVLNGVRLQILISILASITSVFLQIPTIIKLMLFSITVETIYKSICQYVLFTEIELQYILDIIFTVLSLVSSVISIYINPMKNFIESIYLVQSLISTFIIVVFIIVRRKYVKELLNLQSLKQEIDTLIKIYNNQKHASYYRFIMTASQLFIVKLYTETQNTDIIVIFILIKRAYSLIQEVYTSIENVQRTYTVSNIKFEKYNLNKVTNISIIMTSIIFTLVTICTFVVSSNTNLLTNKNSLLIIIPYYINIIVIIKLGVERVNIELNMEKNKLFKISVISSAISVVTKILNKHIELSYVFNVIINTMVFIIYKSIVKNNNLQINNLESVKHSEGVSDNSSINKSDNKSKREVRNGISDKWEKIYKY